MINFKTFFKCDLFLFTDHQTTDVADAAGRGALQLHGQRVGHHCHDED